MPGAELDSLFLDFQFAVAGRYSLDRELGRGGMGIVFLAREVHLDRLVAIKLLPPERAGDPELRDRFLREARLAAKLSHPNIIPIHAVDEVGGFVFFVMAYVDGETLAHRVRSRGPLSASEGSRVLKEAAWALSHAHGQGLVHRDVKPDNILLEAVSGRALVADFGIAAATGDLAGEGVAGTPEFMSPEQALGKPVDARSDLYSLGATAFYAFTGRLVFEGASHTETLAKQVTAVPPSLASVGAPVPRRLAALVERCLAKDPEHRPSDAAALAEQLAVAVEVRREVPALLRDFVKRSGRVDGAGALVGATILPFVAVGVGSVYGALAGFGTLALGAAGMPLSYLAHSARSLVAAGFTHRDLAPAFRAVLDQGSEERTAHVGRVKGPWDRIWRGAAVASTVSAGITLPILIASVTVFPMHWRVTDALATWFFLSISSATLTLVGHGLRVQRYEDLDTSFWGRVWTGRLGRALFGLAGRLTKRRAGLGPMTHRATELSLSVAAEELFEQLPSATREALGDVPAVLRRLQDDAQRLREQHDRLVDLLAAAGEAGATDAYEGYREMRDEAKRKLSEVVALLEGIRLDLLRLHAGTGTVAGVTTQVGLASEVADQVARLIDARAEVERALRFPREIARTPA